MISNHWISILKLKQWQTHEFHTLSNIRTWTFFNCILHFSTQLSFPLCKKKHGKTKFWENCIFFGTYLRKTWILLRRILSEKVRQAFLSWNLFTYCSLVIVSYHIYIYLNFFYSTNSASYFFIIWIFAYYFSCWRLRQIETCWHNWKSNLLAESPLV